MKKDNFPIDENVWDALISICGTNNNLEQLKNTHKLVLNSGEELSTLVYNSLIHNYARCSDFETSISIFNEMPSNMKDSTTYSSMIGICGDLQNPSMAKKLYKEMIDKKISIEEIGFDGLFQNLSKSLLLNEALNLYNTMQEKFNISPSEHHYKIVREALEGVGRLEEARKLSYSSVQSI
uniref:Pentacotripeptide-repeat region of PRORP domain-containing protein n=1 Tax=Arcella intermedia TaxID=1963864 RepID=A0A6B2LKI5_9EUKA